MYNLVCRAEVAIVEDATSNNIKQSCTGTVFAIVTLNKNHWTMNSQWYPMEFL